MRKRTIEKGEKKSGSVIDSVSGGIGGVGSDGVSGGIGGGGSDGVSGGIGGGSSDGVSCGIGGGVSGGVSGGSDGGDWCGGGGGGGGGDKYFKYICIYIYIYVGMEIPSKYKTPHSNALPQPKTHHYTKPTFKAPSLHAAYFRSTHPYYTHPSLEAPCPKQIKTFI